MKFSICMLPLLLVSPLGCGDENSDDPTDSKSHLFADAGDECVPEPPCIETTCIPQTCPIPPENP